MPDPKLPRGAQAAAAVAIMAAQNANDGEPERWEANHLAGVALEAALPLIWKAAQRDLARHVLALDEADQVSDHNGNKGPWNNAVTSLRRLLRGEPLPDVPEVSRG